MLMKFFANVLTESSSSTGDSPSSPSNGLELSSPLVIALIAGAAAVAVTLLCYCRYRREKNSLKERLLSNNEVESQLTAPPSYPSAVRRFLG